jgi:hypothetical protein
MTIVVLEREWETPLGDADFDALVNSVGGCLGLYRIDWLGSLLSADARRLLCQFRGPDTESVRMALRQGGADVRNLWSCTVHDAPHVTETDVQSANVLVRRTFDEPVALEDIQAQEDRNIGCLEAHRVHFMRTFFSVDRRRMACLYHAPDAESVRIAQMQADMPVDTVWAVTRFAAEIV